MKYAGYYNNRLIAISESRKYVKKYLENTRYLKKEDYEIREENIEKPSVEIYKYAKGIYLAERDIRMLKVEFESFHSVYTNTLSYLEDFLKYTKYIGHLSNENKIIHKALKTIQKIVEDEDMKSRIKISIHNHSIVFEPNIEKYLGIMAIEDELDDLKIRYEYNMYKEE